MCCRCGEAQPSPAFPGLCVWHSMRCSSPLGSCCFQGRSTCRAPDQAGCILWAWRWICASPRRRAPGGWLPRAPAAAVPAMPLPALPLPLQPRVPRTSIPKFLLGQKWLLCNKLDIWVFLKKRAGKHPLSPRAAAEGQEGEGYGRCCAGREEITRRR